MMSDQSNDHVTNAQKGIKEEIGSDVQPIYSLPFAVQLQNIFPIEVIARRFPAETSSPPNAQLGITEIQIDSERFLAQVLLEVRVDFANEPRPFEISFKMLGQFTYEHDYKPEMVYAFLAQGSQSVMLPFARELLLSLCTRLQLPPIILALVQVAPPPTTQAKEEHKY